ncbi:MAG: FAD:protein FMN transferase [Pseudomonadota bacterium]
MRRVLLPLALSPLLPPHGAVVRTLEGRSMGTSWSAKAVLAPDAPCPAAALQALLDDVVAQMSHWEDNSDLARFNTAPPGAWVRLPFDFFHVLRYALGVADDSGGAYDPCAGALVERWGFGARHRHDQDGFSAPSRAEIDTLLAMPGWRAVQLDGATRSALQPGGVMLDLSSVAKGFAVDQLARGLEARGVHHYLVEVGGELRGAGVKPDGQPWWVALEGVPDARAGVPTVVALHGLSLATSGDYRRFFEHDGRRLPHTLDPRSGYPIGNNVASVSVLHADCMAADALSTALSVLGPELGLAFAETHALAARFLVRRGDVLDETCSSAFRALLE